MRLRRRREVQIRRNAAEHGVTHDAPDQVELEPGGDESLAELFGTWVDIERGHDGITIPFDPRPPAR
jgi:hypothetical protein